MSTKTENSLDQIEISAKSMVNCFPTEKFRVPKPLAQQLIAQRLYEEQISGDIVDIGCGSGNNCLSFFQIVSQFRDRKIYGFDTFSGYTSEDIEKTREICGNETHDDLLVNVKEGRWDTGSGPIRSRIKTAFASIEIVEGDVCETTLGFKPHSGSIALLYIDCNSYMASASSIANLQKFLSPSSLIFVDGGFPAPSTSIDGEKQALLEYAQKNNLPLFRTFFGNWCSFFIQLKK